MKGELGINNKLSFASGQANLTASPLRKMRKSEPGKSGMWKAVSSVLDLILRISGELSSILETEILQPETFRNDPIS
jgi:hypothetical protein